MQQFSLMSCAKIFIVHKMEQKNFEFSNTGNLTDDFFYEILKTKKESDINWMKSYSTKFNESEIDQKLMKGFTKLFKDRYFGLEVIPSILFELKPNNRNMFEFSVKKTEGAFVEEGRRRGGGVKNKKYYKNLLDIGIPTVLFPSMIFAGVLPIILPALKMATLFTSFINHGALLASIMYLAKQHAEEQEQKQTVYFNAGYN